MYSQLEDENAIEVWMREITWKCLPGGWDVPDVFKNAGAAHEDKVQGSMFSSFMKSQ